VINAAGGSAVLAHPPLFLEEGTMKRFQKAPAHMGKSLTLYVGGGDRTIGDNEVLEGPYWQKFVDQGFLVPFEEKEEAPTPVPAPAPVKKVEPKAPPKEEPKAEPKAEPKPEPKEEPKVEPPVEEPKGTMTKSTADKMAKAQGENGISTSTKPKTKRSKRKK
jgi:hypothetical protein